MEHRWAPGGPSSLFNRQWHSAGQRAIQKQSVLGPSDVFEEFELRTRVNVDSEHLVFVSRDLSISPVLDIVPLVRLASKPGSGRKYSANPWDHDHCHVPELGEHLHSPRVDRTYTSSRKPCYFFESRIAGDTFSYVSYHFKDQSQVKIVDHELAEMLGQLAGVPS